MSLDEAARGSVDVLRSVGDELDLATYSVIGSYCRFSFETRALMGVWWEAIYAALASPSRQRHNFLLWGKPGEGKTRFVTEAAATLRERLDEFCFLSFNCAKDSNEQFEELRRQLRDAPMAPTLCFLDEIDDPAATAFYGRMLELLELNERADRHVVYVLAGSGYGSLEGMLEELRSREKGTDAVSRVPAGNRVTVPAMDLGDRLLVFISVATSAKSGEPIGSFEQFALHNILCRAELDTPREVTIVAQQAAARMRPTETLLRYGHLFDAADEDRRFGFRRDHEGSAAELSGAVSMHLAPSPVERMVERQVGLSSKPPSPSGPLIGRDEELAALLDAVRSERLVTITGPGGIGKTRISVEITQRLAAEFPQGTAFVGFSDVSEASSFLPALAAALDVKEAEGRSVLDGIVALIGRGRVLLVLDNLEQIPGAASDVAALVARCSELRILSTSRAPLRVSAELAVPLEPLELPPAIKLFVDRAHRTTGSFELTAENGDAVRAICERLEGLPLALELAAARLRILDPHSLLDRLDHALDVLTSGHRDSHERQQTMRATIDWSFSLLDERERTAFRRLAVFAGGCTVADAEVVTGSTLDDLGSLVEKALLQTGGDGRLRLLRTISDFARERLDESGEATETVSAHARRYAEVGREIGAGIESDGQHAALARGIEEERNLQAALDTLLELATAGDAEACEIGLQMCGDLWMYWHIRGKNLTARDSASAFLAADVIGEPTRGRAGALVTAGLASWVSGEFEQADREWTAAYEIAQGLDSERELCIAALCRSLALMMLDPPAGLESAKEAAERSRGASLPWAEAFAYSCEGLLLVIGNDDVAAEASFRRALDIQRKLVDDEGAGLSLGGLAQLAARRGDRGPALDLYQQSLSAFEAIGDRAEEARILSEMAWVETEGGQLGEARRHFVESVNRYTDVASVRGVGISLVGLAATAAAEGRNLAAAQIAAGAEVFAHEEGIVNVYGDEASGRELIDRARDALTDEERVLAAVAGRALTIPELLELGSATGE
jgi:predicted ATPase